jgi:hypothetical protein
MGIFTDIAEEIIRSNNYVPGIPVTPAPLVAEHDPSEWEDDCCEWIGERVTHREHFDDWGGLSALHCSFAKWSVDHGRVPCTRQTLEALLRDAGFLVVNGMVQGVLLTEDLWPLR